MTEHVPGARRGPGVDLGTHVAKGEQESMNELLQSREPFPK